MVDLSGEIVRKVGKGQSLRFMDGDFVKVVDSFGRRSFVDLFSGVGYDSCPVVSRVHWAQMLKYGGKCCFRVRDNFDYGFYYPQDEWPRDYGFFMLVKALGGAQGQASDILIAAHEIEKTRTELYNIISEHSGQPYEKVFADGDRDFWMTAEEAKEYGMVDEILKGRK